MSQAFDRHAAILDGNVKRVLTRFFRVEGWPEGSAVKKKLWDLAQHCMPHYRCAHYTQAIMDLGALCCTLKNPNCLNCPIHKDCKAYQNNEQTLYPAKKKSKPPSFQARQFLVLRDEKGAIFLEKRPPTGIWGGLWCLPSLEKTLCPLTFIKDYYALEGDIVQPLCSFNHKFTHLLLEINAVIIKARPLNNHLLEAKGRWLTKNELPFLGLAKPMSFIISQLDW